MLRKNSELMGRSKTYFLLYFDGQDDDINTKDNKLDREK